MKRNACMLGLVLSLVVPGTQTFAFKGSPSLSPARFVSATEIDNEPLICRAGDGKQILRSVDLILLLDNSVSLNLVDNPTDENRLRFAAIQKLLEAVGTAVDSADVAIEVRLGVVTFNKDAEELISLAENRLVTKTSAARLAKDVATRLPNESQRKGTNYLRALERAFGVFDASSSSDRCRVLVWLTDGEFSHGSGTKETREALATLDAETCEDVEGFAARARAAQTRIWPFVVLLAPPSIDNLDPERADAIRKSYDLMRRLTGAPYVLAGTSPVSVCAGDGLDRRIGSIYGADQAENLGPVFEELGAAIAGGQPIDVCPIPAPKTDNPVPEYQSIKLPAPRFLSWISMVSLKGVKLPSASEVSVAVEGKPDESLLAHFEYRKVSNSSLYLDSIQGSRLESGWTLLANSNLEGFCLRAKVIPEVELNVKRRGAELPELTWGKGAENLTDVDLENIHFSLDGRKVEPSQFAQISESDAGRLSARLNVDPSGKLLPDGLSVRITGFSAEPSFDVKTCELLKIPSPGDSARGDTPESRKFDSTLCQVDLRNVDSEVAIDVSGAETSLREVEGCENTRLVTIVNGEEVSRFSGNSIFDVGVQLQFDSEDLMCTTKIFSKNGELLGERAVSVVLTFKSGLSTGSSESGSKQLGLLVDINVKRPPNQPTVWAVTVGLVLLAILLSFGLLWVMNFFLIRLPDPSKFVAARFPIAITSRDPQKPDYHIGDMKVKDLVIEISNFEGLRGNGTTWRANNGLVLQRKLSNPFVRPLEEPKAVMVDSSSGRNAFAYGPVFSAKGLSLPFRRAIVVVFERPESDSSPLRGHIHLLVPNDPREGGREGVVKLLDSSLIQPLVRAVLRSDLANSQTKRDPAKDVPQQRSGTDPGAAEMKNGSTTREKVLEDKKLRGPRGRP